MKLAGAGCLKWPSLRMALFKIFFVMLLGVSPAWSQADLSGFWVFRVPTGDGNYRETISLGAASLIHQETFMTSKALNLIRAASFPSCHRALPSPPFLAKSQFLDRATRVIY